MTNFLTLRNSPLSTLNALNLNYSTLIGSTLTSKNVQFSTLTGSTLINTVISTNTVIATSTVTGSIGIFHNSLGAAAPTVGISGGAGERLILWPGTSATYPYSIGINGGTLWYSVPSGAQHNWYVGGASQLSLSNTLLSLTGSIGISGNSLTFSNTTINANIAWGNQNFIAQASTESQWVADALAADMVLRTTANAIRFTTNNGTSSAMVINTSGQVGIGKTNPSSLLHLHSTSGSINRLTGLNIYTPQAGIVLDSTQSSGGHSWNIWSETGAGSNPGGLNIYDSTVPAYRLTINSSGNVGIGTVNAERVLSVYNTVGGYSASIFVPSTYANYMTFGSGTTPYAIIGHDNSTGGGLSGSGVAYGVCMGALAAVSLSLVTSNVIRMTILTNGNVGIGTANPSATLDVNGTVRIGLSAPTSFIGSTNYKMIIGADAGGHNPLAIFPYNDGNYLIAFYNTSSVYRGAIIGVNSSSISYNTSSDARRKTNITDMPSMIQKIKQLKPRSYIWKESDDKDDGFVAQEVHKVFPQFMTSATAYANVCKHSYSHLFDGNLCTCCDFENPVDKDGKPHYYGLDYGKFTPYLTKALQETIDMVEAQAKRIEVLEAQVTALLQK